MPEHYAVIENANRRYLVFFRDELVFESDAVLELEEHYGGNTAPKVPYFPPEIREVLALDRSETTSVCPLKGQANYWSFRGAVDAVWSYAHPKDAVSRIAGHVAFDTSKGFRIELCD